MTPYCQGSLGDPAWRGGAGSQECAGPCLSRASACRSCPPARLHGSPRAPSASERIEPCRL
eukprot:6194367-Pleurochrysis_carterae.AAC.1